MTLSDIRKNLTYKDNRFNIYVQLHLYGQFDSKISSITIIQARCTILSLIIDITNNLCLPSIFRIYALFYRFTSVFFLQILPSHSLITSDFWKKLYRWLAANIHSVFNLRHNLAKGNDIMAVKNVTKNTAARHEISARFTIFITICITIIWTK